MNDSGKEFRIRPGRIRSTRIGRPKSFINQVLRAAKKAGHTAAQPGAARQTSGFGRSTFGRGRIAFSRNRLFSPQRRVVVKARVARHQGRAFRSAPMSAHFSYLKRDGITSNGEKTRMFDAETDRADDAAFAARGKDDRHHFRFIVSPEDASEMTDLRAFTRDLARQMEADLGTSSIGLPSTTGTLTILISICSCAASTRMARTSSFPVIILAAACARVPRSSFQSSSGQSRSTRCAPPWSGRLRRAPDRWRGRSPP